MVDTLVSGASASRHVGSSPIIRTTKEGFSIAGPFFCSADDVSWRSHETVS